MTVLVDGNNLLYAAAGLEPDRPPGRTQLCEKLGAWARRYARVVRVIFDGQPPSAPRAAQIADPSIEVDYSGPGVAADAIIIRAIEAHSAPRRLAVVSSDREIARAARRRRAVPIRSDQFWIRVVADLAAPPAVRLEPREKRRGLAPDDGAEWMREFGFEATGGDEAENQA